MLQNTFQQPTYHCLRPKTFILHFYKSPWNIETLKKHFKERKKENSFVSPVNKWLTRNCCKVSLVPFIFSALYNIYSVTIIKLLINNWSQISWCCCLFRQHIKHYSTWIQYNGSFPDHCQKYNKCSVFLFFFCHFVKTSFWQLPFTSFQKWRWAHGSPPISAKLVSQFSL